MKQGMSNLAPEMGSNDAATVPDHGVTLKTDRCMQGGREGDGNAEREIVDHHVGAAFANKLKLRFSGFKSTHSPERNFTATRSGLAALDGTRRHKRAQEDIRGHKTAQDGTRPPCVLPTPAPLHT